jgi:hypothetical protein
MNIRIRITAYLLLFLLACKQKHTLKAKIIERTTLNNQLLIKYTFKLNNKQYIDSQMLANTVIPHDSIMIQIEGKKHHLLIP